MPVVFWTQLAEKICWLHVLCTDCSKVDHPEEGWTGTLAADQVVTKSGLGVYLESVAASSRKAKMPPYQIPMVFDPEQKALWQAALPLDLPNKLVPQ